MFAQKPCIISFYFGGGFDYSPNLDNPKPNKVIM